MSAPARHEFLKVRRCRYPPKANSLSPAFDVKLFLDSAGLGRKIGEFRGKQIVFAQGDPAKNVMYIHKGSVKLTVVNEIGKEAVVGVLGPGDFIGEGGLAGQSVRMATATAVTSVTILVIDNKEMFRTLHADNAFSDHFIAYMLERNVRIEEDLVDHLFNSSEKRLARTLLLLARYGKQDQPQEVIAQISQETLAEMIGTTRSRVNFFMNKFKKLGFIDYNGLIHSGEIHISKSLLGIVLHG
jgi:CRP/FNR family transcriptional regulator, cyclic AMP receptor protein